MCRMMFALLPKSCDPEERGFIPEEYCWLRDPLEGILLFCLSLAVLVTLSEMLKELRKKCGLYI